MSLLQPAIRLLKPADPQRNGFGRRFHRRMYPDRPAYQRTVGRSLRHHCQAAHRSLWLHGRRTGTKPRRRFAAQAGRIRQDRRRERPPAESRSPHADRPELDRAGGYVGLYRSLFRKTGNRGIHDRGRRRDFLPGPQRQGQAMGRRDRPAEGRQLHAGSRPAGQNLAELGKDSPHRATTASSAPTRAAERSSIRSIRERGSP